MAHTILLAEDQTDIRDLIVLNLAAAGHTVTAVADGQAALDSQLEAASDLLVLDLMMPRLDGLDVCKALRTRGRATPILMLTAKSTELDRVLGLGITPTQRLQAAFARPGEARTYEKALVWTHWVWFAVPHTTVVWMLVRHPERFPRAAVLTYSVFNLGALIYWAVPTAPPWYAAQLGRFPEGPDPDRLPVRRMMLEEGQRFWKDNWGRLYDVLGGNPYAAMPSLHFGTSLMAARLLADAGPVEGAVGAAYAATLGVALVYLGEHYVVDLLAGAALAEGVRAAAPRLSPAARAAGRAIGSLQRRAAT